MNAPQPPTHVLVNVTDLNVEYLRAYDRTHPNPAGPIGQAAKAIGQALNTEETK